MKEEYVDVVDSKGNPTGESIKKTDAHRQGIRHQGSHIWVYNSRGDILLQKRASCKDSFPGKWDISAAGHVSAGETPDKAALRELYEELGIKARRLEKLQVRKIYQKIRHDWINREFVHEYLYKFDGDIKELKLQKEEVEKVKFFPPKELRKSINDKKEYLRFVPHGKYYFEIMEMIKKRLS